jgi:hypothetical protein
MKINVNNYFTCYLLLGLKSQFARIASKTFNNYLSRWTYQEGSNPIWYQFHPVVWKQVIDSQQKPNGLGTNISI